jgi:hypothetical protein
MLSNQAYRALLVVSVLVALLSALNVALSLLVTSSRSEVARGNAALAQTAQVALVYKELVAALAESATRFGDAQLKGVLTRNGLTLTLNSDPNAANAAANRAQPPKPLK